MWQACYNFDMVISRLPCDFWSFGLQPGNVLFSWMLLLKIAAACLAISFLWLLLFPHSHIYLFIFFPPSVFFSGPSVFYSDRCNCSLQLVQHSHLPPSPDSTDIFVCVLAPVQLIQLLSGSRCCPKLTTVWHITHTDQFTQQKGRQYGKTLVKIRGQKNTQRHNGKHPCLVTWRVLTEKCNQKLHPVHTARYTVVFILTSSYKSGP